MAAKDSFFNDSVRLRDPTHQKRKKARTSVEIPAEFNVEGSPERAACTVTDLGTGGASFTSRSILYKGDKVQLYFNLQGMSIHLTGSVIRVSGKNTGIEFSDVPESVLDAIQRYIHTTFFEKKDPKTKK